MTPYEYIARANDLAETAIRPQLLQGQGAILMTFQFNVPRFVTCWGSCSEELVHSALRDMLNQFDVNHFYKLQRMWSFAK